jgi:hypothetical protein
MKQIKKKTKQKNSKKSKTNLKATGILCWMTYFAEISPAKIIKLATN